MLSVKRLERYSTPYVYVRYSPFIVCDSVT